MKNMLKTTILMAVLTGLFLVVGDLIGGRGGVAVALVMAAVMNLGAYWFSDRLALAMAGARPVSEAEAPELHAVVADLARRAGIPKPRVYVTPDETPNAFATGRNPAHAAVAVTRGLLRLLDRRELEGVLAHELGHVRNRDILISSIAAVLAGAISYLATMAQWSLMFGGLSRDDDDGGVLGFVGLLVTIVVAPLAAMLVQMAISRSREYQADATGARIAGTPEGLASALAKLEEWNRRLPMRVNPAAAQMYIVNPLSGRSFEGLFQTHPPIRERIRRLLELRGA
ncbi:zinc metalloprotease HtpX [Dissulfurirhabdus thermomarina]|uniref:Protease HtpX homolog n=1 Tax=Dissulfurirhabdus thermomarina TaxID=1765737 RepID=A0A6N9TNL3_DISTH|nr:zinc metalloprotease HtpX [Dissulfurirhabdus thermomarina]NDY42638.1 zinc metalloprotease HtpX [Dissulfurirhabdus thermomarina]NMX22684.1 zinc metalloprotease HtpX [Dissulfurirhabdus thermomarina]